MLISRQYGQERFELAKLHSHTWAYPHLARQKRPGTKIHIWDKYIYAGLPGATG